ncbi:MAG: thioredoxin family protein [bacterium]
MKVLTFGAVWCPDCIIMGPIWEEIEKENPWVVREHYDIDKDSKMAKKYRADPIPVFVFLDKDGNEIERIQGEVPKETLVDKLNEYKGR